MRIVLVDDDGVPEGVRGAVRDALRRAARQLRVGAGDVAVRFAARDEMAALNRTWRKKDAPTDVLSFPMNTVSPDGRRHIGDIALCLDIAREQVAGSRDALPRQAARLALHGLLHLLGYDHESDEGEMDALERELRRDALGEAS